MGGCVIAVGETSVFKTAETALTKANLDQEVILPMAVTIIFTFATLERMTRTKSI